jgi:hypothetical protein
MYSFGDNQVEAIRLNEVGPTSSNATFAVKAEGERVKQKRQATTLEAIQEMNNT